MPLHPDVALDITISARCSAHRYTTTPAEAIAGVRAIGDARPDIRDRAVGSWVGYYEDPHTRRLVDALRAEFPGSAPFEAEGRRRRGIPAHTTTDYTTGP